MTGLRQWSRDASIPAVAGEPELRPPTSEELLALVEQHLRLPHAPPLVACEWEYARWKPGTSLTCVHRVHFEGGEHALVVSKRFSGDKARVLADRTPGETPTLAEGEPLRPWVVLPERSLALWTPFGDRELGLQYILDGKRSAKLLRDSELVESGLIRRRRTRFELLRYKPERRAVYRVHLRLRDEHGTRRSFAARVLPPVEAGRVTAARRAFEAAGGAEFTPKLMAAHERHGILIEDWLELETGAPDDFGNVESAGAQLARLHAVPCEAGAGASEREDPRELAPLLGFEPVFETSSPLTPNPRTTWIHGDFHPDQVARTPRGPLLIDLDCLRHGDPSDDLASWIADHLYAAPDLTWDEAADPLLQSYAAAGGTVPLVTHLRSLVARELTHRAAASMRRLELGARERARLAVQLAHEIDRTTHRQEPRAGGGLGAVTGPE